jgi:ATP-dependent exoDNAse (exonuclease V) alpha subunit
MFKELELVVLKSDIPEHGLIKGDIGVIVHKYRNEDSYEVEFVTADGETITTLDLSTDYIRSFSDKEIMHVRSIYKFAV